MSQTYGAECVLEGEVLMEIDTSNFGKIDVAEDQIFEFQEGIIGFPDLTRFALIEDKEREPFQWLQSIGTSELAFVVIEPRWFLPDFNEEISSDIISQMGVDRPEDWKVLVIVTIPDEATKMTANLKGPIIFNPKERKATQIVIDDMPLQHLILAEPE
jgi:flagellar assembly factor FliW